MKPTCLILNRMTNKRLVLLFFFFATAGGLFFTCRTSPSPATRQNYATYYHTENKMLRPRYALYNMTDSATRLYFMVNSTDLLYTKNNGEDNYTARILVSYVVHPDGNSSLMTDSGHVVMNDVAKAGESKQLAAYMDMEITGNGKFIVEVSFRDLNKSVVSYNILYLDHRGAEARNNFLVTQTGTDLPLFKTYVDSGETVVLHYYKPGIKIYARYFQNNSGPAPPPYSSDNNAAVIPQPDSAWIIDPVANPVLDLKKEGWYLFSTEMNATSGFFLTRFAAGFPEVTMARQLLYPLRYLTMKQEYIAMDTASNVKRAVDQFWLKNSGSQERARELIRNFYNRVGAANLLFSTEKEGWKTDRGMIFLIFGPPTNVYRNSSAETWVYSNDLGGGGLTFVFDHIDLAVPTDGEFVLQRSLNFKAPWMQGVDAWRQGHVYTLH
jgi:GWxTD domain-containing protein